MDRKSKRIDRIKNLGLKDGIIRKTIEKGNLQENALGTSDDTLKIEVFLNGKLLDKQEVLVHSISESMSLHPESVRMAMQNRMSINRALVCVIERNYEQLDAWLHDRLTKQ